MELTTNEFQRASRDPEPCVLRLISLPVDPEKNIDQVGWASDIRNRVHSLILEERKGQLEWYYDAMRSPGYDDVCLVCLPSTAARRAPMAAATAGPKRAGPGPGPDRAPRQVAGAERGQSPLVAEGSPRYHDETAREKI